MLLRNDQSLRNNWLRLKLVGKKSNTDAIGAWVEVKAGGKTMQREITATRSYLSQSELPVTFGFGQSKSIDGIQIKWPGGVIQNVPAPSALNTTLTITEQ
jgi:hypothetical protein